MTDDQLLHRPIVILGAPRSGTSLLSQLFRNHPQLYLANEPRLTWKQGNDSRSDCLRPAHATDSVRQAIRKQLAENVREAGRQRLVEKTPSNTLRVGFVDKVLDECIFIHMVRDGLQSVLSIREFWRGHSTGLPKSVLRGRLKEIKPRQIPYYAKEFTRRIVGKWSPGMAGPTVWGPRLPGIEQMARDLDPLEVAAWQWRMCVEHACEYGRTLPPERYTECRLEELDEEELRRLMRYSDLSEADEVVNAFRERFDASAPGGRSKQFADEEVAEVQSLIAPTNAWLATLPVATPHKHK